MGALSTHTHANTLVLKQTSWQKTPHMTEAHMNTYTQWDKYSHLKHRHSKSKHVVSLALCYWCWKNFILDSVMCGIYSWAGTPLFPVRPNHEGNATHDASIANQTTKVQTSPTSANVLTEPVEMRAWKASFWCPFFTAWRIQLWHSGMSESAGFQLHCFCIMSDRPRRPMASAPPTSWNIFPADFPLQSAIFPCKCL